MKPVKGIWEQITTFENLYKAYRSAAEGKRYRNDILAFSAKLEDNLFDLQADLINGTYKVGAYYEFYVYEPKKRLIMSLPFRDRVAQWAIYRIVNPIVAKGYITDSFACIEGRGIHLAVKRLKYFASLIERQNDGRGYYLKLDISKYFYRINHDVLMDMFRRRFADKPFLDLMSRIIYSDLAFGLPPGKNPGEVARVFGVGMPIGNLTSQMFANLYLDDLDQYIKRTLRVHCYARYMDDMVLISGSKPQLRAYRAQIEAYLNGNLRLYLNDKTTIRPLTLGIEFCGYKVWSSHIKLRKSTAMKMRRRLKGLMRQYVAGEVDLDGVQRSLASYNGMLIHCNSYRLRRKILGVYTENDYQDGWFVLQKSKS